jgi:hypothetical protein
VIILIFIVGALIGILAGGMLCVRYLRSEISADIGPQLRRIRLQLDSLEAAVNLALMTRYADCSAYPPRTSSLGMPALERPNT